MTYMNEVDKMDTHDSEAHVPCFREETMETAPTVSPRPDLT